MVSFNELWKKAEHAMDVKIRDVRPAIGFYLGMEDLGLDESFYIPNAIICWLENGDKIIYIAKENVDN